MAPVRHDITRTSVLDALFYHLMVGLGETYLVAFALAAGVKDPIAGMIGVVPVVIGALLQLVAIRGARRFKSPRAFVVCCAIIQASSMFLLGALTLYALPVKETAAMLFALAALYWSAAQCTGPIWNAWVGSILPQHTHLSFFVHRTRVSQLFTLVGLIIGGTVLRFADEFDRNLMGFALIFVAAGIARLISAYYLSTHPPESSEGSFKAQFAGRERVSAWFKRRDVYPIILFLFVTNFATHFSAPFFSPFMLGPLKLGYAEYTILISSAFVARIGMSPFFYRIANRFKVRALVIVGALAVIPLPYLWTLSDAFWYILVIQLLSGFAWGSHELGVTLYLLERLPAGDRSRLLSWANALNAIAMLIGSSLGATMIAQAVDKHAGYVGVFTISSLLRMLPLGFLVLWSREPIPLRHYVMRILSVRPGGHGVMKPVFIEKDTAVVEPAVMATPELKKTGTDL